METGKAHCRHTPLSIQESCPLIRTLLGSGVLGGWRVPGVTKYASESLTVILSEPSN